MNLETQKHMKQIKIHQSETMTKKKFWAQLFERGIAPSSTLRAEATFSRYELACEKYLLFALQLIPQKCSLCSQGNHPVDKITQLKIGYLFAG